MRFSNDFPFFLPCSLRTNTHEGFRNPASVAQRDAQDSHRLCVYVRVFLCETVKTVLSERPRTKQTVFK